MSRTYRRPKRNFPCFYDGSNKKIKLDKDLGRSSKSYATLGEDIAKCYDDIYELPGAGKAQRAANKTRLRRELGELT